jgi:shikimate kinase
MTTVVPDNIFLTGFMGSGKSTVGKLLARLLDREYIDLDEVIVQEEGRTIKEIFASNGEGYFRDCETKTLHRLNNSVPVVYATGGGIVVRSENRILMRDLGRIIYLKTTWSVLQERLEHSTDRPLIDHETGWGKVKLIWNERQPFYNDADLIVETDALSPLEVARKIENLL